MILIGYSGHAFVAYDILEASGKKVSGYCDVEEKPYNPFQLPFLGSETTPAASSLLMEADFFIAVGDNRIRKKVYELFAFKQRFPVNAIHPSAVISKHARIDDHAVMIAAGACINPLAEINTGAICNTGSVIEHECKVGAFAHIGPGTVLCGNVTVGEGSFIGAGAVVKQGVHIGKNVMVGAGAVIIKDIADGETVVGNPARMLIRKIS